MARQRYRTPSVPCEDRCAGRVRNGQVGAGVQALRPQHSAGKIIGGAVCSPTGLVDDLQYVASHVIDTAGQLERPGADTAAGKHRHCPVKCVDHGRGRGVVVRDRHRVGK